MKTKQAKPEEFRMKASDFDKMMRGALSAPPEPKARRKPKKRAKK